eukprot:scaffold91132_cov32-Tisochrysis_lutea.AAC.4
MAALAPTRPIAPLVTCLGIPSVHNLSRTRRDPGSGSQPCSTSGRLGVRAGASMSPCSPSGRQADGAIKNAKSSSLGR